MEIKIDRSAVGIRFGHNAKAVLKVLDIRAFLESVQEPPWAIRCSWKMRRARQRRARPCRLQGGDVRCLQALGARGHFEFNRLAFVQRLVALRLNRGEVDENVLAGLALDESKALAGIKPLYCSLFFQLCFSFLFELFGAVPTASSQKKGLQVWTCSPFNNSKGFTRATNATSLSHSGPELSI